MKFVKYDDTYINIEAIETICLHESHDANPKQYYISFYTKQMGFNQHFDTKLERDEYADLVMKKIEYNYVGDITRIKK